MVSEYNNDQLKALYMVKEFMKNISPSERSAIKKKMKPYLEFRLKVLSFHSENLSDICTAKCFLSGESACCNREGIATFFSDFVINIFSSDPDTLRCMEKRLLITQITLYF